MKRLFSDDDREDWTNEARELDAETCDALRPIVQKWAAKGYSLREIGYILHSGATDVVLCELIDKQK